MGKARPQPPTAQSSSQNLAATMPGRRQRGFGWIETLRLQRINCAPAMSQGGSVCHGFVNVLGCNEADHVKLFVCIKALVDQSRLHALEEGKRVGRCMGKRTKGWHVVCVALVIVAADSACFCGSTLMTIPIDSCQRQWTGSSVKQPLSFCGCCGVCLDNNVGPVQTGKRPRSRLGRLMETTWIPLMLPGAEMAKNDSQM